MLNVFLKPTISFTPLMPLETNVYKQHVRYIVALLLTYCYSPDFVSKQDASDADEKRTQPYIHSSHTDERLITRPVAY